MTRVMIGANDSLAVSLSKNELIPEELRQSIESKVRKGILGPLSPDKEAGAFMLYCCGDEIETIAIKISMPIDIVYVTASHYNWPEKIKSLRGQSKEFSPTNIQKDLANSLLITTFLAVQEQLREVMSGKKKPSECPLIPKNVHGLERLMALVNQVNNPTENPNGGTIVHAQNVQINNNVTETRQLSEEELEKNAAERIAKYNALRGL